MTVGGHFTTTEIKTDKRLKEMRKLKAAINMTLDGFCDHTAILPDDEIHRNYRYAAYFTNLEFSCVEVWRLYRGRGDDEKKIKELKYDFGFDSFNLKDFYATEAALTFVMIAYNPVFASLDVYCVCVVCFFVVFLFFFFQAEDGIRDLVRSRGLGDVYKRQLQLDPTQCGFLDRKPESVERFL